VPPCTLLFGYANNKKRQKISTKSVIIRFFIEKNENLQKKKLMRKNSTVIDFGKKVIIFTNRMCIKKLTKLTYAHYVFNKT